MDRKRLRGWTGHGQGREQEESLDFVDDHFQGPT